MLQMAHQLQLPEQLQELGLSKTDTAVALGIIIARAVSPNSERSTYNWLCKHSGLGELLDFDFVKSPVDKLYESWSRNLSPSPRAHAITHMSTFDERSCF